MLFTNTLAVGPPPTGAPVPRPEAAIGVPNATTAVAGGTLAAPRTLTALPAQGLAPLDEEEE